MRRWNGWGDPQTDYHLPEDALAWLTQRLGPLHPPRDVTLADVIGDVPTSRGPDHPLLTTDPAERIVHARGQSLPDWVALRFGRLGRLPTAIAYPETNGDLRALFALAHETGSALIPYGGGTSVVGGITPEDDGPPSITVDLSRMSRLLSLDATSQLATFGAGIKGPNLEAALRAHGYMLGHFPQSFELSTLGGWIATRSSGQQSLYYGRIEDLFAGGTLITPGDTLTMLPHPASAAGPDLREMVLGSEGRMGFISEATVRITPLPEHEAFYGVFFPEWQAGVQAVREIVQARIPLSMLRLSDPRETEANLILADVNPLLRSGLNMLGQRCMLLFVVTGSRRQARTAKGEAMRIIRQHGGLLIGRGMGKKWAKSRFKTPYLRNELWTRGIAIDTLETIVPWAKVEAVATELQSAIRRAAADERVIVFAHLSHLYPTGASIYVTYLFPIQPEAGQILANWHAMKDAASQVITRSGGTISHQHGVGRDHAPYLEAEKGRAGLAAIDATLHHFDPQRIMNPGKLIEGHTAWMTEPA